MHHHHYREDNVPHYESYPEGYAPRKHHIIRWVVLAMLLCVLWVLWRVVSSIRDFICAIPLVGALLCGSSPLGALSGVIGSATSGVGSAVGAVGGAANAVGSVF